MLGEGYETERLRICGWRSRGDAHLAQWLTTALTHDVTRELPPSWQGALEPTVERWIEARDEEGRFFFVERRADGAPLGLFMHFPGRIDATTEEVRIGYVLGEVAWGRGYASEVVGGFVAAWREGGLPATLLGMVTASNPASCRVLEKNGFVEASRDGALIAYRYEG